MYDTNEGAMKRTKPARVDFTSNGDDGVLVIKFFNGGEAGRDIPLEPKIMHGFEVIAALAWCEANGYTIEYWPGGARAWLGKPWAIRHGAQVKRKRETAERLARSGYFTEHYPDVPFNVFDANFAFVM